MKKIGVYLLLCCVALSDIQAGNGGSFGGGSVGGGSSSSSCSGSSCSISPSAISSSVGGGGIPDFGAFDFDSGSSSGGGSSSSSCSGSSCSIAPPAISSSVGSGGIPDVKTFDISRSSGVSSGAVAAVESHIASSTGGNVCIMEIRSCSTDASGNKSCTVYRDPDCGKSAQAASSSSGAAHGSASFQVGGSHTCTYEHVERSVYPTVCEGKDSRHITADRIMCQPTASEDGRTKSSVGSFPGLSTHKHGTHRSATRAGALRASELPAIRTPVDDMLVKRLKELEVLAAKHPVPQGAIPLQSAVLTTKDQETLGGDRAAFERLRAYRMLAQNVLQALKKRQEAFEQLQRLDKKREGASSAKQQDETYQELQKFRKSKESLISPVRLRTLQAEVKAMDIAPRSFCQGNASLQTYYQQMRESQALTTDLLGHLAAEQEPFYAQHGGTASQLSKAEQFGTDHEQQIAKRALEMGRASFAAMVPRNVERLLREDSKLALKLGFLLFDPQAEMPDGDIEVQRLKQEYGLDVVNPDVRRMLKGTSSLARRIFEKRALVLSARASSASPLGKSLNLSYEILVLNGYISGVGLKMSGDDPWKRTLDRLRDSIDPLDAAYLLNWDSSPVDLEASKDMLNRLKAIEHFAHRLLNAPQVKISYFDALHTLLQRIGSSENQDALADEIDAALQKVAWEHRVTPEQVKHYRDEVVAIEPTSVTPHFAQAKARLLKILDATLAQQYACHDHRLPAVIAKLEDFAQQRRNVEDTHLAAAAQEAATKSAQEAVQRLSEYDNSLVLELMCRCLLPGHEYDRDADAQLKRFGLYPDNKTVCDVVKGMVNLDEVRPPRETIFTKILSLFIPSAHAGTGFEMYELHDRAREVTTFQDASESSSILKGGDAPVVSEKKEFTLSRVSPDDNLLTKLTSFHDQTGSGDDALRPNMDKHQKGGRVFIAKIDTFGFNRYFMFKTNDDVAQLVQSVRDGGGMSITWLCYDLQPGETIVEMNQNLFLISEKDFEMEETAVSASARKSKRHTCDSDGRIEINGETKTMIGHIHEARLDAMDGKENPFINTDIITYDENGFVRVGTVLSANKAVLMEVAKGNYMYTPWYAKSKGASGRDYVEFGAIILGTKDQAIINKLRLSAVKLLMKDHKRHIESEVGTAHSSDGKSAQKESLPARVLGAITGSSRADAHPGLLLHPASISRVLQIAASLGMTSAAIDYLNRKGYGTLEEGAPVAASSSSSSAASSSSSPEDPDDRPGKPHRKNCWTAKNKFLDQIRGRYTFMRGRQYKLKKGAKGFGKARYLKWDACHNDIEAFDKTGKHLGSMDPKTMRLYKPADPSKTITTV